MDKPIRGRGAAQNPDNRFEELKTSAAPEFDGQETGEEGPCPQTKFLKDTSRTIVSENQSPDVGFDASVNPYRGCEHGCVYCLAGDTPILMADGTTRALADVRPGDEIYGTEKRGFYRYYVKTRIRDHWKTVKPSYRVTLEDGTAIVASADHRFLTDRGWKFVTGSHSGPLKRPFLTRSNKLMGTGAFAEPPEESPEYKQGYLCGMVNGDGHLDSYSYVRKGRSNGDQHRFRLALIDDEGLERTSRYLNDYGVETQEFLFQPAAPNRREARAIRTSKRLSVERIEGIVCWPLFPSADWNRGFLAGLFDAEGSYSCGILRISNANPVIIGYAENAAGSLGFRSITETCSGHLNKDLRVIRIAGGLKEHLRFFHSVNPAILRKRSIEGQALKNAAKLRVDSIEPLDRAVELYDISTGTGDFIANGVVSHNCYARPTHEYLGFSAGLDFETKILVKEDAPELLRKKLMSKGWKPRPVIMSGVTDLYQPVERRLQLTRRCLEVLAEFRNPVAIITKNALVTRDIDVLSKLAAVNAVSVTLSITTLDAKLQRLMEPRTSHPEARLGAIEALAKAGIPAGVNVAPVVPGLTDHEMPAILEAAARRGAAHAGYVPLRLPYGVSDLFQQWLETHYPTKKERVLARIREIRGGRMNDARFGTRMRGEGLYARQLETLFAVSCRKAGIGGGSDLSAASFRRPGERQLDLFEKT